MDEITVKRKKKKKLTKKKLLIILAVLIILTGLIISVYPYILSAIFNYRQQNLVNMWMAENAGIGPGNINEGLPAIPEEPELTGGDSDLYEEDIDAFFDFNHALNMMAGILNIPSLSLTSPILRPETEQNLNIGVCEVTGSTAAPGGIGNYILSGHYSRIRGRHFNRLPDIEIGASVFISNLNGIYEYEVYEILQVKAEDNWAVRLNVRERIATLITCDYTKGEPYGRWIVMCRFKSSS
ncbi:MAG: sortase [Oscillospiraceae bacterium]|nr:sortase [Oscillospiraceae bacterium]